jgi:hypothetical protein
MVERGSESQYFPGRRSPTHSRAAGPAAPSLDTLWGLLERISELIRRALPIIAAD